MTENLEFPRVDGERVLLDDWRVHPSILVEKYAVAHAQLNGWSLSSKQYFEYQRKLRTKIGSAVESGSLAIRDWDTGFLERPAASENIPARAVIILRDFCGWANSVGLLGCPKDAMELAGRLGLSLSIPLSAAPPGVRERLARRVGTIPLSATSSQATRSTESDASEIVPVPVPRFRAQEEAILNQIAAIGESAKALPRNAAGKPGVKARVKALLNGKNLFVGGKVFDKAWDRLRANKDICDRP